MVVQAVLLLGMVAGVAPARAADDKPPLDVKALYERGTALYALRKFADAAVVFEQAFEVKPDPAILYNAAQAHRLAGHKSRALELYESLLRLYGSKLPNTAEIGNHVRDLKLAIESERRATASPPVTPWPESSAPAPEKPAEAPAAAVAATAPAPKVPVTKKRWFWGVVGTGAALVVAGVTVGIVLGTSRVEVPEPSIAAVPGN